MNKRSAPPHRWMAIDTRRSEHRWPRWIDGVLAEFLADLRRVLVESASVLANAPPETFTLRYLVRGYIEKVVEVCDGNRSMAARLLGVHRRSLQRMLEKRFATAAEEKVLVVNQRRKDDR